jgi:acetoin utilization protein AcuB
VITSSNLINSDLPVLSNQDDPIVALNLMDQFRVAHLPVVREGKYIGLVSETTLMGLEFIPEEQAEHNLDLLEVSVKPDDHILDVLKIASQYHISVIPVTDKDNNYVGSISQEDLVEKLSEMQGAHQRGGIIVLEMWEKDYSLQQIARIIEENDAKILSTSVSPGEDGKIEVNLKVNQPETNPMIQSFERFGYHVKGNYQEPEYTEDLRKRYEELMRMLNI